jgi:hypothetical protein
LVKGGKVQNSSLPELPPGDVERIDQKMAAFRLRVLALKPTTGPSRRIVSREEQQSLIDQLSGAALDLFHRIARIYLQSASTLDIKPILEQLERATIKDAEVAWRELTMHYSCEELRPVNGRPLPDGSAPRLEKVAIVEPWIEPYLSGPLLKSAQQLEMETLERIVARESRDVIALSAIGSERARSGPRPNLGMAQETAQIVDRTRAGKPWKTQLDAIAEALDDAHIPCPKPWKKRGIHNWVEAATADREVAIKAIDYRLRIASESKKS